MELSARNRKEWALDSLAGDVQCMLAPYIRLPRVEYHSHMRMVQRALGLVSDMGSSESGVLVGVHGGLDKTYLVKAIYEAAKTSFFGRRIFLSVGTPKESHGKRRDLLQLLLESGSVLSPASSMQDDQVRLSKALSSGPPILLVLDDLHTQEQLCWLLACEEKLMMAVAQLPAGSRVLLTSGDRKVVTVDGHERNLIQLPSADEIFRPKLSQYIFGSSTTPPDISDHQMQQALKICGGVPFAAQVLSRLLKPARGNCQVQLLSTYIKVVEHMASVLTIRLTAL